MFATRLVLSLAAVCLLGPLAAQAQKLPPDIAASKTVRVALNVGYPPLEMRDTKTNEIVGFDIDLARAMAKVLDVKLEWQDGAFEQMSPSQGTRPKSSPPIDHSSSTMRSSSPLVTTASFTATWRFPLVSTSSVVSSTGSSSPANTRATPLSSSSRGIALRNPTRP